jgi:hypothetical protein
LQFAKCKVVKNNWHTGTAVQPLQMDQILLFQMLNSMARNILLITVFEIEDNYKGLLLLDLLG